MDWLTWSGVASIIALIALDRFKAEISNVLKILFAFMRRVYRVGDTVQLWNYATGNWKHVVTIKRFRFHISAEKRGCWVEWPDSGVSKIPLLEWFAWLKRPAPF